MVNRENMNKLADALESGKYKQGQRFLRNDKDRFCCLGVASDISEFGVWEKVPDEDYYEYVTEYKNSSLLPIPVQEWLGVTDVGDFTKDGQTGTLTELNDNGYSFADIVTVLRDESVMWMWEEPNN